MTTGSGTVHALGPHDAQRNFASWASADGPVLNLRRRYLDGNTLHVKQNIARLSRRERIQRWAALGLQLLKKRGSGGIMGHPSDTFGGAHAYSFPCANA